MSLLSDSEASGDEKLEIRINQKFAGNFERDERQKELVRSKELLREVFPLCCMLSHSMCVCDVICCIVVYCGVV
jgi:hypothetical protein